MSAYYNEIDPEAVEVLKELVRSGVIAPGDVDGRSIKEVTADDVRGYTQCHFFAGAGLWSVAARLAGWPDDRALWSASCPCQGESLAGRRLGADDPRHLWPDLFRLVRAVRPSRLVGEQVAAAAGTHWLDGVCADLASEAYAARAVDLPACAVDAPHQRNRLFWVALADAEKQRGGAGLRESGAEQHGIIASDRDGCDTVLVDAAGQRRGQGRTQSEFRSGRPTFASADIRERNGSWWSDGEWIDCHDGKARRAKPGLPMLVDGLAGRASVWRLAGNSIVPQLAAEVIAALAEAEASLTPL